MGKADKDSAIAKREYVPYVSAYASDLDLELVNEFGPTPTDGGGAKGGHPHITLKAVDDVVRYIEQHAAQPSLGGAKFSKEISPDWIPWGQSEPEMVFAPNAKAHQTYTVLREFYYLLRTSQYEFAQYCVSLEAARRALFAVYPNGFQELPPITHCVPEATSELKLKSEALREITWIAWPAAERFNLVVGRIAEIVKSHEYRGKIAREKAKLKQRAISVTSLITGLLRHHDSLTVVAMRLSVRQDHGRDFLGDRMRKALGSLIGDRRSDALLNQSVGYFWVLQESFRARLRLGSPMSKERLLSGEMALHYDVVMFFDATRQHEAHAIGGHIGECWKAIAGQAGYYRRLSGRNFLPLFSRWIRWRKETDGQYPAAGEIVGLVREGSLQASNLVMAAKLMVASAMLRKPQRGSRTLLKDGTRRFGKSDLLTGCGFDKAGRASKLEGSTGMNTGRQKRPNYVDPGWTLRGRSGHN